MLIPLYAGVLSVPVFVALGRRRALGRRLDPTAIACWVGLVFAISVLTELIVAFVLAASSDVPIELGVFVPIRLSGTAPVILAAAALGQVLVLRERALAAARDAAAARASAIEARLAALMDQLRPHFLFNTLQSISTLIHRDPEAADAMLGRLSDLLRACLLHRAARTIPLEEELRMVDQFLGIARLRTSGNLETSILAPPEVVTAGVPPFLLQPLVENALRHGLGQRGGAGRVTVAARAEDGTLVLEVSDDGAGWLEEAREGVGLRNVRERLAALYGDGASLSIEPHVPRGSIIRVRLPLEVSRT
jgi:LytS/YehU family sensor histidine kinase